MGLIDFLLGRTKEEAQKVREAGKTFEMVTAYKPVFTTWQGKIYESELVRAAIDARARHISKINVKFEGTGAITFTNKLKYRPNKWTTWPKFLYQVSTMLDVANNVVIVPIYDDDLNKVGIFPLMPRAVKIKEYKGELWLTYTYGPNYKINAACKLADCAILNRFQLESMFWGENNNALDPTMQLLHLQKEGIKEAIENGASYRFMAQADNFTLADDLEANRVNFTERTFGKHAKGKGGVLLFPHEYKNIQQINASSYNVDAAQAEFIRTNVFNYFGVNQEILQNAAIGDKGIAFYEGFIEPWAINFSEALKFMIYSDNEIAHGSFVFAGTNRIQYMSMADKKAILEVAGDRGYLTINEGREILNLPMVPWGDAAFIRGEYYPTTYKLSDAGIEQTPTNEEANKND